MAAGRDSGSDDADLRALQDLLGPRKGGGKAGDSLQADQQQDVDEAVEADERAGGTGPPSAPPAHETPLPGRATSEARQTAGRRQPAAPLARHADAPAGAPAMDADPDVPANGADAPVGVPFHGADARAGADASARAGPPAVDDAHEGGDARTAGDAGDAGDDRRPAAGGQPPRSWMADVIEAEPAPNHALSPLDPAIGLADRLHADRLLSVPVRPWPRVVTAGLAGVFLVLWVLSLRASALGRPWPDAGWPASAWFFVLAVLAAGALAGMAKLWPARELRLPLAPNQHEQFTRIEAQARAMQRLVWIGAAAALAGLLAMGAAFAIVPPAGRVAALAVGSVVVAGGAVAALVGLARWLPMRMLYVQTLVLRRLEALGLGDQLAMDPRTADVILALDGLLGKLPESAVRQFLSRPEADWYLELVGRLKGDRGGR